MASEEAPPQPVETAGRSESALDEAPAAEAVTARTSPAEADGGQAQTDPTSASSPAADARPPKELTKQRWFKTVERVFSLFADVAVVVGIMFALYQIKQAEILERRRVAIEIVGRTRSPEFLKAYRLVKVAYHSKAVKEEDKDSLLDSLNYVMNVYDNIAIMYISDAADRCMIKNSIQSGAREMSQLSQFFDYPTEYRGNFDSLLTLMERENCGGKTSSDARP